METNVYAILGGMIGVIVFMHFSEWLNDLWSGMMHFIKKRKARRQGLYSKPVTDTEQQIEIHYQYVEQSVSQKRIFTRQSRRMVRIWRRYGLMGLAGLTPILFSIPLGTFFMTRLEKNKKK